MQANSNMVVQQVAVPVSIDGQAKGVNVGVQVDSSLGLEEDQYLRDSILNMVEKPLNHNEFMSLDEVMLEWALLEEFEFQKMGGHYV